MKQVYSLVKVIEALKKESIDYVYIESMLGCFDDIKKKYPMIDWQFLECVKEKSKEEIKNWINICIKTVHIL